MSLSEFLIFLQLSLSHGGGEVGEGPVEMLR